MNRAPTPAPYDGLGEPTKVATWAVISFIVLLLILISVGIPIEIVALVLVVMFALAFVGVVVWVMTRPINRRHLW